MNYPKCPKCGEDFISENKTAIAKCDCGAVFSIQTEKVYKTSLIKPKPQKNGK